MGSAVAGVAGPAKTEASSAGRREYQAARRKVLFVEYNAINRALLHNILCDKYEPLEAENGAEALDILAREGHAISAIILDIVMPVMDGYEFLRRFQQITDLRDIPVVVSTQKDSEADEVRALASGAFDFLTKPYNPDIIRRRVENLINFRETYIKIQTVERDTLTGMYNKESFYENAMVRIMSDPACKWDIVCTDIEKFPLANGLFGKRTGDAMLKRFADILRRRIKDAALFGHLDADQFAMLVPRRAVYHDETFANITREFNNSDIALRLIARFGVFPADDISLPVSVMCDRALLAARNLYGLYGVSCASYDKALHDKILAEQSILNRVEGALSRKEFEIYLQPKYNLSSGLIAGAEALVRWNDPERGLILPGEFIPVLERNGFITALDSYVLDEVCAMQRRSLDAGVAPVPVSVNISIVDVYTSDLAETVMKIIDRHGVSPELIHLDLTRKNYSEDQGQVVEVAARLRNMGFKIEMDDLGVGYSLNTLSRMPVDYAKLDMAALGDESRGGRDAVSFVLNLARLLDLSVIAEKVGTREQAERLRSMNCSYAQGYFYAKPMPAADFGALLSVAETTLPAEEPLVSIEQNRALDLKPEPSRRTIVVIGAEKDYRSMARDIFSGQYEVAEFTDGEEALAFAEFHRRDIEVVLLNYASGTGRDAETLASFKSSDKTRNIPVIVVARSDADKEAQALEMGAEDFLTPPFAAPFVRRRVDNVVSGARLRAQKRQIESRTELLKEAYYDYLTGIYNRRGWEMALQGVDFDADDSLSALYMLDVDNLKACNDTLGHSGGDRMLVLFTQALRRNLRGEDIAARIGGDEFVVLMRSMPSSEIAKRKGDSICRSIQSLSFDTHMSCSIGLTVFGGTPDFKLELERADEALYVAKKGGKGRCCLWTPPQEPQKPE